MKKTKRVGPDQDGRFYRLPVEGAETLPVRTESAGSVLPDAQERKIKRLIEDGCGLGSVLLHKVEGGRGITAIVSPHGHVEWAK